MSIQHIQLMFDGDDLDKNKNVTYKPGSIGSKANIMLKYQNNSNDKGGNK